MRVDNNEAILMPKAKHLYHLEFAPIQYVAENNFNNYSSCNYNRQYIQILQTNFDLNTEWIEQLCLEFSDILYLEGGHLSFSNEIKHIVDLNGAKLIYAKS